MLSEKELETLRNKLAEYEGEIPHMYLDSKGLVTVGVGNLITSVQAAQALPFINQAGEPATADEIKADYDSVKQQQGNRIASFYKPFTKLIMTQEGMDELTNKHIDTFYKEIKKIFSEFDDFPSEAKLALLDLIFNLGMTNLKNKWPNLNKAVNAKNWGDAALASRRRAPVSDARNKYVKDLFEKAASLA